MTIDRLNPVSRRFALVLLGSAGAALALPPGNPLAGPGGPQVEDPVVAGSTILRLWLPDGVGAASRAIVFSHGANSNAAKYDALTKAWAADGHPVAAVLHRDSPDHPGGGKIPQAQSLADRLAGMRQAAAELQRRYPGLPLVAAGHSYGALVAQLMGGAQMANGGDERLADVTRIIAFSPPGPIPGYIDSAGWEAISVPMFVATGTADVLPMIAPIWQAHAASFEASTVSPRWLWVGEGVDHYFANRIGRPERAGDAEQARLFEAALGASTAFIEGRAAPAQPPGATLTER